MTFVRTVLGDISPEALGAVDYHEHLFHASPLLPGEDTTDPDASREEYESLLASGFSGMIDATPIGLGRRPTDLAMIARSSGGNIVASTGRHRDAHYAGRLQLTESHLTTIFQRELTEGMAVRDSDYATSPSACPDVTDVRAGVIKVGIDYWSISAWERAALQAAGRAHVATGAPIMVHTERASGIFEALDILADAGAEPSVVAFAHVDRNPDPGLHREVAATGAYLGYDGSARYKEWPESVLVSCLESVCEHGMGDQVLLGGDVARRSSFVAYGGMPGLRYLGERYLPRLRTALGEAAVAAILVENARRFLTWRPSSLEISGKLSK